MTETAPTPRKASQGGGLIRSSLLLSGLTLVSRFMGLARDLVLTARLGASATIAADAYYTALLGDERVSHSYLAQMSQPSLMEARGAM